MATYRPPKPFKPPKGISTDAIYLYGPDSWQKDLAAQIRKTKGTNILIADDGSNFAWNLDALMNSETALFYLKTSDQPEILLALLTVPAWSQWAADLYVYMTPQFHLRDEVEAINERSKNLFETVDKADELGKIGVKSFNYLKETADV